jgi:hypothetical protein
MLPQEMKETFEVILANRNFLYTLFYKTFGREPDAAYLSVLGSDAVSDAFTLLSQESEDTMSKAAAFAAAARDMPRSNAIGKPTDFLRAVLTVLAYALRVPLPCPIGLPFASHE